MTGLQPDGAQSGDCKLQESDFPFKFDWYQTDDSVVVTLFKRNSIHDKFDIQFTDCSAVIEVNTNQDRGYRRIIDLAYQIDPERSNWFATTTNVNIKLRKVDLERWDRLEAQPDPVKLTAEKNWDQVAKEIGDDQEESEAMLNTFFGKIYADGSDEVKRAMIKSFTESGGTELNTDWERVSSGQVTIKPPQGMEWKTWDK